MAAKKKHHPTPKQKKAYYAHIEKSTRRLVGVMKKHNPAGLKKIIGSF